MWRHKPNEWIDFVLPHDSSRQDCNVVIEAEDLSRGFTQHGLGLFVYRNAIPEDRVTEFKSLDTPDGRYSVTINAWYVRIPAHPSLLPYSRALLACEQWAPHPMTDLHAHVHVPHVNNKTTTGTSIRRWTTTWACAAGAMLHGTFACSWK